MLENKRNHHPGIGNDAGRKYEGIGSPIAEIVHALNGFRADCGSPACRPLAHISETVSKEAALPGEFPLKIPMISKTTVSDILGGRRKRFPAFLPVVSIALSCQRFAVNSVPGRHDQGTAIVPYWAAVYARHAESQGSADPLPPGFDAIARAIDFTLTEVQREFLASDGPHGQVLAARAELGHPQARYRSALLMGTEKDLQDCALALLVDVASTGHPKALDLLEALSNAPGSAELIFGEHAYQLARQARAAGAKAQAFSYLRTAARGGVPEAVYDFARFRPAHVLRDTGGALTS